MRAEHLRQWLISETQDNSSNATNWLKVVTVVKALFRDSNLAEECMWQKVVLISKGKGESQGIGLVKVLWKAVMSLFNCRLTAAIYFQNTLHFFWAGKGTGTFSLKAKLL